VLFRIGLCGDRVLTEDALSHGAPLFFHERIDILGIGPSGISGNRVVSRCFRPRATCSGLAPSPIEFTFKHRANRHASQCHEVVILAGLA
jgi:hypothetical protein